MRILEAAPSISLRRVRFISACLKAIIKDERKKDRKKFLFVFHDFHNTP